MMMLRIMMLQMMMYLLKEKISLLAWWALHLQEVSWNSEAGGLGCCPVLSLGV